MDNTCEFKFSCPHCGRHLAATEDMSGMVLDCPACGKQLTIPSHGKKEAIVSRFPQLHCGSLLGKVRDRFHSACKNKTTALLLSVIVVMFSVIVVETTLLVSKLDRRNDASHAKTIGSTVPVSDDSSSGKQRMPDKDDCRKGSTTHQEQQAENEEARRLYEEAMRYYDGNGVLQNYSKAVKLLKEASEKGSADANGRLAMIYYDGLAGEMKNTRLAIDYANKSGMQKSRRSTLVLADCYLYGEGGIEQDFARAYDCYKLAMKEFARAGLIVGLMQYHGVGTTEDKETAAETFYGCCKERPSDTYAGEAAICLGYMYGTGEGITKNRRQAEDWLTWGTRVAGCYLPEARNYADFLLRTDSRWRREEHYPGMNLITKGIWYFYNKIRLGRD